MKIIIYVFICVMMNHKISVKVAKVLCGLNQTRRTGQKNDTFATKCNIENRVPRLYSDGKL